MGNLYDKGLSHQALNRQFQQSLKLPQLLLEKDRIVDQMKRHISQQSCSKKKREYLYELSHRDFSEWTAVITDPCEKANALNQRFLQVYSCIKKISREDCPIVLIAI